MDSDLLRAWLERPMIAEGLGLGLVALAAVATYYIARGVLLSVVHRLAASTAARWDDALVEAKVFARLAMVAPALAVLFGVPLVPDLHPLLREILLRVAAAAVVVLVAASLVAALRVVHYLYALKPENRLRPIKGYIQLGQISVSILAAVLVLARLLDESPVVFLSGLGALAAVLLLVFRDTILSFVASLQLTANDLIHVGDWIEMPQYGADGDVIDVALHTVKVQNWDKTITTIPTHRLIEESFKNWRGMQQAGGRRIKRAILIDLTSIRFLSDEEIERAGRIRVLREYVAGKRRELAEHNARGALDAETVANQRRLTNVGTFRAYLLHYLKSHPRIHSGMTLLVRQRPAEEHGLPIEIYCFTRTTVWAEYEDIQSDIFDHIFAVLPEFGLRVYQSPTGHDFARWGKA